MGIFSYFLKAEVFCSTFLKKSGMKYIKYIFPAGECNSPLQPTVIKTEYPKGVKALILGPA
jgi:hypothetical protein